MGKELNHTTVRKPGPQIVQYSLVESRARLRFSPSKSLKCCTHRDAVQSVQSETTRISKQIYISGIYNIHLGQIWIVSGSDVTDSEGKMGRQSDLRNNFHHPDDDFKGQFKIFFPSCYCNELSHLITCILSSIKGTIWLRIRGDFRFSNTKISANTNIKSEQLGW